MSTITNIQGQLLDVTVVACKQLKNTEQLSRQDPYVCLEYANSRVRIHTCTDGGRNPTFQEKFQIPLIEGLRELNITVWNSNTFTRDGFIGAGIVNLYKVLSEGYDDSSWTLQTRKFKYAGEVNLILHFSAVSKKEKPLGCTSYALPPASPSRPPQPYPQPSPPTTAYPPVGGYPYTAPPSAPPTYPGACYPSPQVTNQYHPPAYPSSPYPSYSQSNPPPPVTRSPYLPLAGSHPGVYPPSY